MTNRLRMASAFVACFCLSMASLSLAQAPGEKQQPYVIVAPVGNVQLRAGGSTNVELNFRVGSDFHINSNHPKADYLIPTALKLNASGADYSG